MDKRQEFADFLYNNNISCATCKFNTTNVQVTNTCSNVCSHPENDRSEYAYWTTRKGQVCDLWEEFIDESEV